MDFSTSKQFITSLAEFLQHLCNGYVEFNSSVDITGHLYVSVDTKEKLSYVVNEKLMKYDPDLNNISFSSKSFCSYPSDHDEKKDIKIMSSDDVATNEVSEGFSNFFDNKIAANFEKNNISPERKKRKYTKRAKGSEVPQKRSKREKKPNTQSVTTSTPDVSTTSRPDVSTRSRPDVSTTSRPDVSTTSRPCVSTMGDSNPVQTDSKDDILSQIDNLSNEITKQKPETDSGIDLSLIKHELELDIAADIPDIPEIGDTPAPGLEDVLTTEIKPYTNQPKKYVRKSRSKKSALDSYGNPKKKTKKKERPIPKCKVCGEDFLSFDQVRVHMEIHGPRPFVCNVCGKTFAKEGILHTHRWVHSKVKPFKCEMCGMGFAQRANLINHSRKHSGEQPFVCEVCGKGFYNSSALLYHRKCHTGEKPFPCGVCGKNFRWNNSLRRHIRTHTGEKPYSCEVCGLGFAYSCHLRRHRTIHTGEKPFKCEVCGTCFARKNYLRDHRRTHTGEKPFPCSICGKHFSQGGALLVHKRNQHPGSLPPPKPKPDFMLLGTNPLVIDLFKSKPDTGSGNISGDASGPERVDDKTDIIAADDKTHIIAADDKTHIIAADDKTHIIAADDKTHIIAADDSVVSHKGCAEPSTPMSSSDVIRKDNSISRTDGISRVDYKEVDTSCDVGFEQCLPNFLERPKVSS